MKRQITHLLVIGACITLSARVVAAPAKTSEREALNRLVNKTIATSLQCLERSVDEIKDTLKYPTHGNKDLKWETKSSSDWVSGFYPGCLWYSYALSGNNKFQTWARQWTSDIARQKNNTQSHDLGFRFMCTYYKGLCFGDTALAANYKANILTAAKTFSKRYSITVGECSSNWDRFPEANSYPVVIDVMMNLELLFWASQNGGDASYYQMARHHALTTWRDFVRDDGGTYHIVRYDKNTGSVINKGQLQGDGKETTWTRGHSWLVYGLIIAYRYTHEKIFLDKAKLAADYFLRNLPQDGIAPWDFQSQVDYRDASASAVVASALYELITYLPEGGERAHYSREADHILSSLCQPPYFVGGSRSNCLLDHSVQDYPVNSHVDVPCIFGDYYLLEALYRYKNIYLK